MREGKWTYSWPNLDQKFQTLLGSSEWALSAPNGKDLYSGLFRYWMFWIRTGSSGRETRHLEDLILTYDTLMI
mgnify:CR=1 FL=1